MFSLLFSLLSLFVLPILGLFAFLVLRKVLHLRLWFIVVLFLGSSLLLNHATVRLGVRRFHVVTWFGSCGNRKFKSADVDAEVLCPVCESVMVRSVYMGKCRFVKDIGHADYVAVFVDERLDENGKPNWVAVVGGRVG